MRYFFCTTCEYHWEAEQQTFCEKCGECFQIEEMTVAELRDFADEQRYLA